MDGCGVGILIIECVLFIQIYITDGYYSHAAFLISICCVLQWTSVPFKFPLTPTVSYVISLFLCARYSVWHKHLISGGRSSR